MSTTKRAPAKRGLSKSTPAEADKIRVKPKVAGRPLGVPNKVTRSIKDSLIKVYNDIGGDEALGQWAKENPGEFYTKLWVKALPVKLVGDPDNPIQFEVIIRPHGAVNEALPAIEHGVTVEGAEYEVDQ